MLILAVKLRARDFSVAMDNLIHDVAKVMSLRLQNADNIIRAIKYIIIGQLNSNYRVNLSKC